MSYWQWLVYIWGGGVFIMMKCSVWIRINLQQQQKSTCVHKIWSHDYAGTARFNDSERAESKLKKCAGGGRTGPTITSGEMNLVQKAPELSHCSSFTVLLLLKHIFTWGPHMIKVEVVRCFQLTETQTKARLRAKWIKTRHFWKRSKNIFQETLSECLASTQSSRN